MKLMDVEAVAGALGISRQSVARMIADGSLQAIVIRAGRRKKIIRVRDDVLKKFLGIGKNEPLFLEPAVIHPKKEKQQAAPPVLAVLNDAQEGQGGECR